MADIYLNLLTFSDVAPGAPTSLPHLLNVRGEPALPDRLEANNTDFTVTATDTEVTVLNTSNAAADVQVWVELKHSIARAFPPDFDFASAGLPFKPETSGPNVAGNVQVSRQGSAASPVQNVIYVRSTGDDTNGDGSLGNPYRTIARALTDVPVFIVGAQWIIDCTDLGTETITEPIIVGPHISPDTQTFNATPDVPPFTVEAPLTFRAAPTVLATLQSGDITGNTAEANSGIRTYNTNQNFTLDQFRGDFLIDANNNVFAINSVTAGPNSDIEVCADNDFTTLVFPVEIVRPSCEVQNTSGTECFIFRNWQAQLSFGGIRCNSVGGSAFSPAIRFDSSQPTAFFRLVRLNGLVAGNGAIPSGGPTLTGCTFDPVKVVFCTAVSLAISNSLIDATPFNLRHCGEGCETMFWRENISDGSGPFGGGSGIDDVNAISLQIRNSSIRNAPGDATFCPSNGTLQLIAVNISGAGGNALTANGCAFAQLNNVGGSGNGGLGAQLTNGAQVNATGGTTVTGTTGDYQVGANAPSAGGGAGWGALTQENDLAAGATSQLCRLFT